MTEPAVRVILPGMLTTIQDLGRTHVRHLGIAQAGGADKISLALSNSCVGNAPGAAVLECTVNGPTLEFLGNQKIAIAGADMQPTLNDRPIPSYRAINVKSGDIVAMGHARKGLRSYVAIAGGFSGDKVFDSLSTDLRSQFGGHRGRNLATDDTLHRLGEAARPVAPIAQQSRPSLGSDHIIRLCAGPEAGLFNEDDLNAFFSRHHIASRRADRMGLALESTTLATTQPFTMNSSAVFPGTIQCPPGGAPFILLCDAQTTGGYPRIAQLVEADIPVAAQIAPGDRVWFKVVSPREARAITAAKNEMLSLEMPDFQL